MEAEKSAGKRQRTKYDAAFRAEAIRRVLQDAQAAARVAQVPGMSEALLGRWVRAARAQAIRPAGNAAWEQGNKQLKAQLVRAELERDMLTKALTSTQMLDAHYHKSRAAEPFRFRGVARFLLAGADAVPMTGRQGQRLVCLAPAYPRASRRASASRLASSCPARVHHAGWPLGPASATSPVAARRSRRGAAAFARLAQRLRAWLSVCGLRALCTRVSTPPPRTTQANPQAVAAANKLATRPAAPAPNQLWVGDSTYLALATGQWAYLACWRDAFSRRVVGWHVGESLHTDLILSAFNRAVAIHQPPPGLLVHADRGSQYPSEAFTPLLDRTQAIASLSRPGNP